MNSMRTFYQLYVFHVYITIYDMYTYILYIYSIYIYIIYIYIIYYIYYIYYIYIYTILYRHVHYQYTPNNDYQYCMKIRWFQGQFVSADFSGFFLDSVGRWRISLELNSSGWESSGYVWKCWVYSQWNSHLIGIMIINHYIWVNFITSSLRANPGNHG